MPIVYPMIALSMVGLMLPWLPLAFIIPEDQIKKVDKKKIKPVISKPIISKPVLRVVK